VAEKTSCIFNAMAVPIIIDADDAAYILAALQRLHGF